MAQPTIFVKVIKRKKVIFLLVTLTETIEEVRRRVGGFFPGVALTDIMMLKGDLILNDDATMRETGFANGDVISLRFYVSGRGEGGFWDSADT